MEYKKFFFRCPSFYNDGTGTQLCHASKEPKICLYAEQGMQRKCRRVKKCDISPMFIPAEEGYWDATGHGEWRRAG